MGFSYETHEDQILKEYWVLKKLTHKHLFKILLTNTEQTLILQNFNHEIKCEAF